MLISLCIIVRQAGRYMARLLNVWSYDKGVLWFITWSISHIAPLNRSNSVIFGIIPALISCEIMLLIAVKFFAGSFCSLLRSVFSCEPSCWYLPQNTCGTTPQYPFRNYKTIKAVLIWHLFKPLNVSRGESAFHHRIHIFFHFHSFWTGGLQMFHSPGEKWTTS